MIEAVYSLTPTQEEILQHVQAAPDSHIYADQNLCTLYGDLSIPEFFAAWQDIVDRHPAFRTGFGPLQAGDPRQLVYQQCRAKTDFLDWRRFSAAEQKSLLREIACFDFDRGFDLQDPPLLRVSLIRIADRRYKLLWSTHHLIADAWCLSIWVPEVFEFYETRRSGGFPDVRPAASHRDYVSWLAGRRKDLDREYWIHAMEGFGPQPAHSAVVPPRNDGYASYEVSFSAEFSQTLRRVARQERVTLCTLFQGAWALIARDHSTPTFGVVTAGRSADSPTSLAVVGLLMNILPFRAPMEPGLAVGVWLRRLQGDQMDINEHQYCSLEEIRRWCGFPPNGLLFESVFVFVSANAVVLRLGSLEVGDLSHRGYYHHALVLRVTDNSEVRVRLDYDLRKFSETTTTLLLSQLTLVLAGMCSGAFSQLGDLARLKEAAARDRRTSRSGARRCWSSDAAKAVFEIL